MPAELGARGLMRVAVVLVGLFLLLRASPAEAGSLKDAIKDLWGGDGIRLQPTPPPFPSHDPHFTASSLSGLDDLGSAIASNLRAFSFNSTVTAFTFDVERGIPMRTTDSLGPLIGERAVTLGAGRLNVGLAYTRIDYRRFEGRKLDDLELTFQHEDSNGDGIIGVPEFELDQIRADLDLELEQDIFALFATYGLTRTWDVGIIVPIVHLRFEVDAQATIVRRSAISALVHNFGPDSDPQTSRTGGEETGLGDIVLRSKYNFLRGRASWPDLAVLGQVKLPTGDEDDLLGTGETDFLGLLVASRTYGPITPHVNVGYEVSTAGSEENNFRYVAGFDARVHRRAAVALDVLGRWKPDGTGIGDHLVDVAVGGRWNPFGSFLINANIQVPLNRSHGLRADFIWTVGVDYTF